MPRELASASCPTPGSNVTKLCLHCAQPVPGARDDDYCCSGCRAARLFLEVGGLTRYYDLRSGTGVPVGEARADHKWIEALEDEASATPGRLALDVQGIHCAACVWVLEALFRRRDGGGHIVVNPSLGTLDLGVSAAFDLPAFVGDVEALGYRVGPRRKRAQRESDDLLLRMGICFALAGNATFYAAAIYLGLRTGPVFDLLDELSYAAAVLSVLVGGTVFFRSAVAGLRRRVLHLDVPIALGIGLAFAGSTWSRFFGDARASYVDTVSVFIALMLFGRWLQQRAIERNRTQLLEDEAAEALWTRRVEDGRPKLRRCGELHRDDVLSIAPGDLLPIDGAAVEAGLFSLDWIDGESEARHFDADADVPAGAFNAGVEPIRVRATCDFQDSSLPALLRASRPDQDRKPTAFWQRLSLGYVISVLAAATGGALFHFWRAQDALGALDVATAVLVVTCPCAFGIAAPLAYELALAELRRSGLFVRSRGLLDRLVHVDRVVFDKTGTLTTGALTLLDEAPLAALDTHDRDVLFTIAAASSHPKSAVVAETLEALGARLRGDVVATEVTGAGVEAWVDGARHRLGSPTWAAHDPGDDADLVYAVDGEAHAALETGEQLRPDAANEMRALTEAGYTPYILSGDLEAKVSSMAERLSLDGDHALAEHRPEDKAQYILGHDPDRTLFVGDGVNDALAVQAAACSGTPTVDRPFVASRADFFFSSAGLGPVTQVLRMARRLATTLRRVLTFAVLYNLFVIALAWAGVMRPWVAAVLMPASSLATLAYVAAAQRSRRSS